jgi:FAD/FMN-containing dehydrogenase
MTIGWQNWSGNVRANPIDLPIPGDESEVQEVVQRAISGGHGIRVVGSAHSFSPIVASDGYILSLDKLTGLISSDLDACEATIWAGTKLHALGEPLRQAGLALANQGDIDRQALAGALSTGTHGTGPRYGNLSSRIKSMRLVTGLGEIVQIDDPEMLRAARVSVGTFGVVLSYTLSVEPAYRLHEKQWSEGVDACFDQIDELIAGNDHFEFFWRPVGDICEMKTLNETDAAPDPMPTVDGEYIDHSYIAFPSDRNVKFNECEYSIPADHGPACFYAIRKLMQEKFPAVKWPVEYRTQAADDSFISAASGRETVTISIHEGAEFRHEEFFQAAELIFAQYKGRPHWGKYHSLNQAQLKALYPEWDRFQACRRRHDPNDVFLNRHLKAIFG